MQDQRQENVFHTGNTMLAAMHAEADNIQRYMDIPANLQDPATLTYRLADLDVYMARLSDMLIRARTLRDRAQNRYIAENEDRLNKLTATISNRMISSHLSEYTTACNRLDAMYKTIEHLTRDLVTQISYIKQQMNAGIYQ